MSAKFTTTMTAGPCRGACIRVVIVAFGCAAIVFLLATAAMAGAAPGLQNTTVRSLEAGRPIEQELGPGESHVYEVAVAIDQYACVTVAQRNIDVVLNLLAPDGRPVAEADTATGSQGSETLRWIADMSGVYRVQVRPLSHQIRAGRYEILLAELRPRVQPDDVRLDAQLALIAAKQLRGRGDKASFQAAIETLENAIASFQAVGDRSGEATAVADAGQAMFTLGDLQAASEHAGRAAELFAALGDRFNEGRVLLQRGEARRFLGAPLEALPDYTRALLLLRAVADRDGEGEALADIGEAYYVLHDLQRALDYYAQALPLLRASGRNVAVGTLLNNFGVVHRNLGEPAKALAYYLDALPAIRAAGDTYLEAVVLDNVGVLHLHAGRTEQARESFNLALPLRRKLGNRRGEGLSLDNIGATYLQSGDPHEALKYHDEALALLQAVGDQYKEALVLGNIGAAYYALHALDTSLAYHTLALTLFEAVGDRLEQSKSLKNIAVVKRDQGRLAESRADIERAMGLLEFVRAHAGSPEQRASFFATMTDHHDFHIDLLMGMHAADPGAGHDLEALRASEQARARSLLELLAESYADIRQGVDPELVARERDLSERITSALDDLAKLSAGGRGDVARAVARKAVADLTDAYRQAQAAIRERSPRYAAFTQPEPLGPTQIQQQVLDAETTLLQYALGAQHSYVWAVTPDRVLSYRLPPRAEIETRVRRVYGLLTTRQPQPGLSDEQRRARELEADAAYAAETIALSRILLGPVASELGSRRLVIVGDGALQYLPFAALPAPDAQGHTDRASVPLIAEHEIVSLPSASVLAVVRREMAGRQPAPKALAVFADPVFSRDDARVRTPSSTSHDTGRHPATVSRSPSTSPPALAVRGATPDGDRTVLRRLLFTRDEAEAILAMTPPSSALRAFDFQATRTLATSTELGLYRMIHFSTHGLLDTRQPELSGLVFSLVDQHGRPQDGFLRLHEIYNLKLNADLVVLSACQTALGEEVRGEGLVGLTRGFMYAGAPRVVASLWQVDDAASAHLMKSFYRGMLQEHLTPAAALRRAQLDVMKKKQWQTPYYWAAFVLQGEWSR